MTIMTYLGSRFRVGGLTYLVGIIALAVYVSHGFNGALSRDLGIYSYGAQQVAGGAPPYVDILTRAGPLGQIIPAGGVIAARAGGITDVLGMRLLFLVIAVACVCLVYLLARDVLGSATAGVAASMAFLSFYGFIEYASYGPREKTPMVLFVICALVAVVHQRWLAAGVCTSLATLTWQPAFLVGIIAALVGCLVLQQSERLKALLMVILGGLIPVSIFLLYFAAVGALWEFVEAFVLINAKYTVASPSNPTHLWAELHSGYGVTTWVMLVGLISLFSLGLSSAIHRDTRETGSASRAIIAVGTAGAAGAVWTFRDFNGWPDAFVLLPFAAVGFGGLAQAVAKRVNHRVALTLTLAWTIVALIIAMSFSIGERDVSLLRQRSSVEEILGRVSNDASILSIKAPQALVLSGKKNPSRHQMFTRGLSDYIEDTYPGGIRGYGSWIKQLQPTIIALGGRRPPAWLGDTIKTEYRRAGRAPGWTWYIHRSVAN